MILLLCCNTYAFSAPFGGADRMIGTNPIIAAIPTDKECPIVMDISTTNVAMGKIQAAEREKKPIPLGWANDYDGKPTTDPAAAYALTSIAAHKGYGLAVIVDALSTFLSGAAYGSDIGLFSKLEKENTGFFMVLIDPSKFMPIEQFKAEADRYVRMMKESRKADGVEEIFLPGEIERKKYEQYMKTGIEVSEALQAELAAALPLKIHTASGLPDIFTKELIGKNFFNMVFNHQLDIFNIIAIKSLHYLQFRMILSEDLTLAVIKDCLNSIIVIYIGAVVVMSQQSTESQGLRNTV